MRRVSSRSPRSITPASASVLSREAMLLAITPEYWLTKLCG
jgi:hypothetical protein